MGRWTCTCGYFMNDHNCPDENAFMVYSEPYWNEILGSSNTVNVSDILIPEYFVYKCPNCGRIMFFGKSNRCISYKSEFEIKEAEEILNADILDIKLCD